MSTGSWTCCLPEPLARAGQALGKGTWSPPAIRPYSLPPTRSCTRRLVHGDESALAEAYTAYGSLARRVAVRVTRGPAAAEDVAQRSSPACGAGRTPSTRAAARCAPGCPCSPTGGPWTGCAARPGTASRRRRRLRPAHHPRRRSRSRIRRDGRRPRTLPPPALRARRTPTVTTGSRTPRLLRGPHIPPGRGGAGHPGGHGQNPVTHRPALLGRVLGGFGRPARPRAGKGRMMARGEHSGKEVRCDDR
jgi:hypothetical protein